MENEHNQDANEGVADVQNTQHTLNTDDLNTTADPDGSDPEDQQGEAQRNIIGEMVDAFFSLFRRTESAPQTGPSAGNQPIPLRPRNKRLEREQEQEERARRRAKETLEERLERYRQLIESFEEDRENVLEKIGRWVFLFLAYVAPILMALAVGKEIGDAYSGPLNWSDGWSLGVHSGAYFGELSLAMMSLASAVALRHIQSDRTYIAKAFLSFFFLVLFSLASGLAQWYIATSVIATAQSSGQAALIFRVTMPPAVDIASLVYISVMGFKSLKKHLANMKMTADALRELNDAEIDIRKSQNAASQQERREDLLMRVESLQADAVIKAVEKSLNDQNDKRGNGWQMRG